MIKPDPSPAEMTDAQLIEAVGTKVMGWTAKRRVGVHFFDADGNLIRDWNPLTDLNHAWEVIGRMRDLELDIRITCLLMNGYRYEVELDDPEDKHSARRQDQFLGRAICLAALQAVRG